MHLVNKGTMFCKNGSRIQEHLPALTQTCVGGLPGVENSGSREIIFADRRSSYGEDRLD